MSSVGDAVEAKVDGTWRVVTLAIDDEPEAKSLSVLLDGDVVQVSRNLVRP
jgi:hypothetical protein